MSVIPTPNTNRVLVWNARGSIAEAIKYLSDHDEAMVCPVADWLVTLRTMMVEMRQYDGPEDGG
jgi:hypothetical protein